jgi:phosphoserine phosphatase
LHVLISNLAPISEREAEFFLYFFREFERKGHTVHFWSCLSHPLLDLYHIPMGWRVRDWPQAAQLRRENIARALEQIDADKWLARINILTGQETPPEGRYRLLEIIAGTSDFLLDTLQPALFLSWNTLCPHTGIAHELCRARGIPSLMFERGFLPSAWYLERGGLLGHSVISGLSLEDLVPADQREAYAVSGRALLRSLNLSSYSRYAQHRDASRIRGLEAAMQGKNGHRIVFLPPDDTSLAFLPADHDDRRKTLPHFTDSFEAAKAVARANPDGLTVFKPHPSFKERTFDTAGLPGFQVMDHDFHELIAWADIVVTTGSGLGIVAWLGGKPVVLMGRDIWHGKGIFYEALEPSALPQTLAEAAARRDGDAREGRFQIFCGYLLRDYLVWHPATPAPARTPAQAVAEIHETYLAAATSPPPPPRIPMRQPDDDLDGHVLEGPQRLTAALRDNPQATALVDFDHTLFYANSTEQFLDHARPTFLAAALLGLLRKWQPWMWVKSENSQFLYQDFLRVAVVSLCMPWTCLTWLVQGPRLWRRHCNEELTDRLLAVADRPIVIVSYGFSHIIRPMLRASPLRDRRLVCSRLFPWPRNIRRKGKEVALANVVGEKAMREGLAVTDSLEDAPLLNTVKIPLLVRWKEVRTTPCTSLFYYPFRYTNEGKYPGRRILINQQFGEDLVVALLGYGFQVQTPAALLGLLVLFVSFFAVYEIGYYENDFLAAKKEKKPIVSPQAARFAHYPIRSQGWLWGICLGAAGCALVGPLSRFPYLLASWLGCLVAVRVVFRLHNILKPAWRIPTFTGLQIGKTFSYAAVLPLHPVSAIILVSQILRQCINYLVYRIRGSSQNVNRQQLRLFSFIILSAGYAVWAKSLEGFVSVSYVCAAAWCVYRVIRERYGQVVRSWPGKLRQDLNELFS